MKILLITEKYEPETPKRDGGVKIVNTLKESFGSTLSIMQFGSKSYSGATWNFDYPVVLPNRFEQRLANAKFIAEQIKKVEKDFTSETEKELEKFMLKKGNIFEITNRIPNKMLIKNLLPLTSLIPEKKKIVSEETNQKIDQAKKNNSILEIALNNKVYKIKFIGASNGTESN